MPDTAVTFGNGLNGIISGTGQAGSAIITHGAGRGMDAPILEKTATRLEKLGYAVLRFNFGYMGRRPAPSQGGKNEQPELESAIEYMKAKFPSDPVLIGKSFGARVNSYVAARREDVRALVFYGLPMQGMSKTSKPRDWSHLAKLKGNVLFITGDKDKLCPLERLEEALPLLTCSYDSQVVPGDHSFKPRSEDLAIDICTKWISELPALKK